MVKKLWFSIWVAVFAFVSAHAQQDMQDDGSSTESGGIQEIIVRAQRRSENAQDVPLTLLAVTGEELARRQIINPLQLSLSIPNLEIKSVFGASTPQIFMRGLGLNDFSEATGGTVGMAVDEVFLNSALGQMLSFYDLNRVEVLKGPQGTLFGRNTTGGLIGVYSNTPGFEVDPTVSVTFGNYEAINVRAASSFPIIDDVMAARVSVAYNKNDGYRENLLYGTHENSADSLAGRFQLLYRPTSSLEIQLKLEAAQSRGKGVIGESLGIQAPGGGPCTPEQIRAGGICANPFTGYIDTADLYTGSWNLRDNPEDVDTFTFRLGISYDMEWAALDSITAYSDAERSLILDTDSSPFRIYDFVPGNSTETSQWSQEFRLTSDSEGPFNWILGAFYLTETLSDFNGVESDAYLSDFIPGLGGGPEIEQFFTYYNLRLVDQDTETYAVFGHFDFAITSQLSASIGLRQTWDDKTLELAGLYGPVNLGGPATVVPPLVCCLTGDPDSLVLTTYGFPSGPVLIPSRPLQDTASMNEPTWRFSVDYVFDNALLFASAARGTRSPSFNTSALFFTDYSKTDTEQIDTYEIGLKSDFSPNFRLNLTAFFYEGLLQEKSLADSFGVPTELLTSVDVQGYGLEGDFYYATPLEGLDFGASIGLLETEYKSFLGKPEQVGNQLTNAPKVSASAFINYDVSVSDNLFLLFSGDANYKSDTFLSSDNSRVQFQEGYTLYNANITLGQVDDGFSVSLWGKNLTDEAYYIEIYNVDVFGYYLGIAGEPRTYGVTLNYVF